MESPGPVDYLVVEFPPERQDFTGEMAEELRHLSESGTVTVLRVLLAVKDSGGRVTMREVGPVEQPGAALAMAADVAALMADDDLLQVTERMAPRTVVGVIVWENTWARGFAAAAAACGRPGRGAGPDTGRFAGAVAGRVAGGITQCGLLPAWAVDRPAVIECRPLARWAAVRSSPV